MKSVKNFFDNYAKPFSQISGSISGYYSDNEVSGLITKFLRGSMLKRYEYTIENIKKSKSKSILDIGCGPGDYSLALRGEGINEILALDFSKNMLELAKKTEKEQFGKNIIDWRFEDYLDLKIKNKFDASIAVGVLDYIENPELFKNKIISETGKISIISFPKKMHFLSLQRKIRYKNKCYLRFYTMNDLGLLFNKFKDSHSITIKNFGRDFLVKVVSNG